MRAENMPMRSNPSPTLPGSTDDELVQTLIDTDANADGSIVFSLGPNFEEATLDVS